ncbi:hypothetical protein [Treponema socranskii]|uniref:hypothetical protein n=1 Tax=Treponema socranskii TaxID=53419 RepID=UPI003D6EB482
MRTENRDKKDIQDAVNGMTYKFIKAIDEKGITTTYKELNKKIKLVLSESNFRKMITRLKKAIKDGKHEKLGRIRDRETGMSLQISQSQLLVHDILQKLSFDEKKFYSLDDAKEVSQNRSINKTDALSQQIEELNDKLNFITSCVEGNKRESISKRANDLYTYITAIKLYMPETLDDKKEEGTIDNGYIFMRAIIFNNYCIKFRKSKKIADVTNNFCKCCMKDHNAPYIFVFVILPLIIFIQYFDNLVEAYKSAYKITRRKIKKNNLIKLNGDSSSALVIESIDTESINEQTEEHKQEYYIKTEQDIMEQFYIMTKNVYRLTEANKFFVDKTRINDLYVEIRTLFNDCQDMVFNPKVIDAIPSEMYYQDYFLHLYSDSYFNMIYRLYISRKVIADINAVNKLIEDYFERR